MNTKEIFSINKQIQSSMQKYISFLILLFIFNSCKKDKMYEAPKDALFVKIDSLHSNINFKNQINDTEELNIFSYRNFYNGGGVGIADINNDKLPDIFFTSNQGKNKLYLNKGNMKFEDISKKAGVEGNGTWSTGVTCVDINNDGLMDIYVCHAGFKTNEKRKNELFINKGNQKFEEKAKDFGLDIDGFSIQAAFFDYDKDGDLDCYILANSPIPVSALAYENRRDIKDDEWQVPDDYKGGGDKLLQNNNGKFEDVSEKAGIFQSLQAFGLGITVGDVNGDNWTDIYISNDFFERDYLYINQKNGTFKDEFEKRIKHSSIASMGADMQDINNDGKPEIFVTEMLPENDTRLKQTTNFETYDVTNQKQAVGFYHQFMQNTLQLNQGNGTFSDIAFYSGTAATDWSWGALIFDMDSDGFNDIYVSNGIKHDLTDNDFMDFFANDIIKKMEVSDIKKSVDSIIAKMPTTPIPNYAFQNNKNLTFSNKSSAWGLAFPTFSSGSSYADLDNDGDLDLVVNNVNSTALLFENKAKQKGSDFLKIHLKGSEQNRNAIGTSVYLYAGNSVQKREQYPSRGFQSSVDFPLIFGLEKGKKIDSLVVVWDNNKMQIIKTEIKSNSQLEFDIKNANATFIPENENIQNLYFTEIPSQFSAHKENIYYDFDSEGLIPSMLSCEGPAMAKGDVNGDGFEDVFIGGALGQEGKIYLNINGNFQAITNPLLEKDKGFEDVSAVMVDVDNDKDLDLIVGSGGNTLIEGSEFYRDRLYFNDGKGNFNAVNYNINSVKSNTSVVAAFDFNNDGFVDLFFGNNCVSKIYGAHTQNTLMQNDGKGNFKEVTDFVAKDLKSCGMVNDAIWEDINGDNRKDLIVLGDWMSPKIFMNTGKKMDLKPDSGLENSFGWWHSILAVDVDKDGDLDLVLGNNGQNNIYFADNSTPAKMFVKDYDKNGTTEAIFTHFTEGKDKPIHSRREIAAQLPVLKKENLAFSEYAKKSYQEIFTSKEQENTIEKMVNERRSLVAINNGKGNFKLIPLPAQAQFSSVYSIQCFDMNTDGNLDIILAGNNYNLRPQFSRDDSFSGDIFLGNGKGNFTWIPPYMSGLQYNGQVRNILFVDNKLILGMNNGVPKVFKFK